MRQTMKVAATAALLSITFAVAPAQTGTPTVSVYPTATSGDTSHTITLANATTAAKWKIANRSHGGARVPSQAWMGPRLVTTHNFEAAYVTGHNNTYCVATYNLQRGTAVAVSDKDRKVRPLSANTSPACKKLRQLNRTEQRRSNSAATTVAEKKAIVRTTHASIRTQVKGKVAPSARNTALRRVLVPTMVDVVGQETPARGRHCVATRTSVGNGRILYGFSDHTRRSLQLHTAVDAADHIHMLRAVRKQGGPCRILAQGWLGNA